MAGEMRLALFAAKDLVGVEVGVVDEAHARRLWWPIASQRVVAVLDLGAGVGGYVVQDYSLGSDARWMLRLLKKVAVFG